MGSYAVRQALLDGRRLRIYPSKKGGKIGVPFWEALVTVRSRGGGNGEGSFEGDCRLSGKEVSAGQGRGSVGREVVSCGIGAGPRR